MRKLWSHIREQTQGNEKRQGEDSSYPKAVEGLLRATARKNCPKSENVDNRMIAPQDLMSVNPDESWSSKTEIFGYDQQICPGTFLFL